MKPRVMVELLAALGLSVTFALWYYSGPLGVYFLPLLFGLSAGLGFLGYMVIPLDILPVAEGTQLASGPPIGDDDFPSEEFDKEKATDGVELAERIHKAVGLGDGDYGEVHYAYPGLKGTIIKGKRPGDQAQSEGPEPKPDFDLAPLPPAED
jgi:hypothetical protein